MFFPIICFLFFQLNYFLLIKGQRRFQKIIEDLFDPNMVKITYNSKRMSDLVSITSTNRKAYRELDVWIPELKLGIEYQVCEYDVHLVDGLSL